MSSHNCAIHEIDWIVSYNVFGVTIGLSQNHVIKFAQIKFSLYENILHYV